MALPHPHLSAPPAAKATTSGDEHGTPTSAPERPASGEGDHVWDEHGTPTSAPERPASGEGDQVRGEEGKPTSEIDISGSDAGDEFWGGDGEPGGEPSPKPAAPKAGDSDNAIVTSREGGPHAGSRWPLTVAVGCSGSYRGAADLGAAAG